MSTPAIVVGWRLLENGVAIDDFDTERAARDEAERRAWARGHDLRWITEYMRLGARAVPASVGPNVCGCEVVPLYDDGVNPTDSDLTQ